MQPWTMTQPSKPSASCVHACKQQAVPALSKHNYESTQLIWGLYFCSQSMPSITSDVSYSSTRHGTPGMEYSALASTTTIKSKQEMESLTTVFSLAKVTDKTGAAAVVHPVFTTMLCLTKLCMALLSTKHSTLTPLHYAMNDSNQGPFSSKTFVTLALAGVLHWVVVAITLVLGFKVFCWWHGIPSLVKPSFTACNSAIPTLDTGNNKTSSPSKPNEFTDTLQPVLTCPAFSFPTEC